jgi:hypothetical protein
MEKIIMPTRYRLKFADDATITDVIDILNLIGFETFQKFYDNIPEDLRRHYVALVEE